MAKVARVMFSVLETSGGNVKSVPRRPVALSIVSVSLDGAAEGRVGDKPRVQVAVDARVEEERAENLRATLDADGERPGEIADVGVALDEVRAAAIAASGPLAAGKDLGGRHKPQSSVD